MSKKNIWYVIGQYLQVELQIQVAESWEPSVYGWFYEPFI